MNITRLNISTTVAILLALIPAEAALTRRAVCVNQAMVDADKKYDSEAYVKAAVACTKNDPAQELELAKNLYGDGDILDLFEKKLFMGAFQKFIPRMYPTREETATTETLQLFIDKKLPNPFSVFSKGAGFGDFMTGMSETGMLKGSTKEIYEGLTMLETFFYSLCDKCEAESDIVKNKDCFVPPLTQFGALGEAMGAADYFSKTAEEKTKWLATQGGQAAGTSGFSCAKVGETRPACGEKLCCMDVSGDKQEICYDSTKVAGPIEITGFRLTGEVGFFSVSLAADSVSCIEGASKLMSAISGLATAAYMMA